MRFTVLSHAGLLVESDQGKKLICDPWIIGSCYWRSWWNYPPVRRELIDGLKPDAIYLTHIHWDHFHSPSLARFDKDTPIIVPKGNYSRCKDDLTGLGFTNVTELRHGEPFALDADFRLTSYQFGIFLDSAALVECNGVKLLNLNDSKHMGPTLGQIVKRHQPIDFVFRSHSSANSRLSYEIVDDPTEEVDDMDRYIQDFARTAQASGARYAIPFASNHCHLHRDSWPFNEVIQDPSMVREYFERHGIDQPTAQVMVSGDTWDSQAGFAIEPTDCFTNKTQRLLEYRQGQQAKLDAFYDQEDRARVNLRVVEKYFRGLARKLPWLLKWRLRNTWYTYVLYCEQKPKYIFRINVSKGRVEELPLDTDLSDNQAHPLQIHTSAFIFLRSIGYRIFSHMSIGKRVFYKVTKAAKGKMEELNLIFNLEEYDMLPLWRNLKPRSLQTWCLRWREILLYLLLVRDKLLHRRLDFGKYLRPAPAPGPFACDKTAQLAAPSAQR